MKNRFIPTSLKKRKNKLRLSLRLMISFIGVQLIGGLIILMIFNTVIEQANQEEQIRSASFVSTLLNITVQKTQLWGNMWHTQNLFTELVENAIRTPIHSIMIVDENRKILAHSNPDMKDKIVDGLRYSISRTEIKLKKGAIGNRYKLADGTPIFEIAYTYPVKGNAPPAMIRFALDMTVYHDHISALKNYIFVVFIFFLLGSSSVFFYLSHLWGRPVERMSEVMQGILDYAPLLIVIRDQQGNICDISKTFQNLHSPFDETDFKNDPKYLARLFDEETQHESTTFQDEIQVSIGSRVRPYQRTSFPISHDSAGRPTMTCIIAKDMSQEKRYEAEIKKYQQDLEEKVIARTAALEQANKELRTFSYSVSHDLRSPLRAIDGFSLALKEDYGHLFDENGLDYIARVRNGSKRMGEIIDGMLSLAQLSQSSLFIERVNLSDIVTDILSQLAEMHPEKKVSLEVQQNLYAACDINLIKILLNNLLGNAWKYSADANPAKIIFQTKQLAGETVFQVIDNGVGFDMRYAENLFLPFHRLHKDKFEGLGIGLATVGRIVERHGGRIWAESQVNQGATFFFTLAKANLKTDKNTTKPQQLSRTNEAV